MIRLRTTAFVLPVIVMLEIVAGARAQDDPRPRPGLTAEQTKRAVRAAGEALAASRPQPPADAPQEKPAAKRREYVVAVERLVDKQVANPEGGRAVVTIYRYEDDSTVYSTVDLASGRVVESQTAQHARTPLSDGEYQSAQELASEQVAEVRELKAKFGPRLTTYAQFSQYTPEGEDRVHRVVHILYRVDKRDLSVPRPVVDLTTQTVKVPAPEAAEPDPAAN